MLACGLAASLLAELLCINDKAEGQSVRYKDLCWLSQVLVLIEGNGSSLSVIWEHLWERDSNSPVLLLCNL